MSTYTVTTGDTFALIARKRYGTEQQASRIAKANPGAAEPLTPGTSLVIPVDPAAPQNTPQAAASSSEDEVALLIEGERFRFWESIRIRRSLDTFDTVSFNAPFDATAPGFRETFVPLSYKRAEVTLGGVPFFTGTAVAPLPDLGNDRKVIGVDCYSLPGVMGDCTAPASAFPIEFGGQNLREIAETCASWFGVKVEFLASPGAVFDDVALDPTKKVLQFLIELAQQRNLITASSTRGALVFLRPIETSTPVATLRQGESPLLSVSPQIDPQNYYSHVTGIEPTDSGTDGAQYTVKNNLLPGVVRPFTFKVTDATGGDLKTAVEAKAARMIASAISYAAPVATWRDPNGDRWEPGTSVIVQAPDAMIYDPYEFLIRHVDFDDDGTSKTAVLNLVLPGSLGGKIVERLPWQRYSNPAG